jgi:hypothetical protein
MEEQTAVRDGELPGGKMGTVVESLTWRTDLREKRQYKQVMYGARVYQDNILRKSISLQGILIPLLVDQELQILDGYRRFDLAQELDLAIVPYRVVEIADLWSALEMILQLHLAQRDHTPARLRYLRAAYYELQERKHGRYPLRKYRHEDKSTPGYRTRKQVWEQMTREIAATRHRLDDDAHFKQSLDHLLPELRELFLARRTRLSDVQLRQLAQLKSPQQQEIVRRALESSESLSDLLFEQQVLAGTTRDKRTSKRKIIQAMKLVNKIKHMIPAEVAREFAPYLKILDLQIRRTTVQGELEEYLGE